MKQEIKVTMTIEVDVTLSKSDIQRELCNAVTKSKDLELICIDSIKEEAELYNLDP